MKALFLHLVSVGFLIMNLWVIIFQLTPQLYKIRFGKINISRFIGTDRKFQFI